MSSDICFVYSPRFKINNVPSFIQDIPEEANQRLTQMRDKWMEIFGLTHEDLDPTADLEDWTESAIYLLETLKTGKPVYVLYQALPDEKWIKYWESTLPVNKEVKEAEILSEQIESISEFLKEEKEKIIRKVVNHEPRHSPRKILSKTQNLAEHHTIWKMNGAPEFWPEDKPMIMLGSYRRPRTDDIPGSFPNEKTLTHENSEIIMHPGYLPELGREAIFCKHHYRYSDSELEDMKKKNITPYQETLPDLIETCIALAKRNDNKFFLKNITEHKSAAVMRAGDLREHSALWRSMKERGQFVMNPIPDENETEWTENAVKNLIQSEGGDIYYTEFSHLFMAQKLAEITYEYRVILIDGKAVCGAGAIEKFSPIFNTGDNFDPKVEKIRNKSGTETRPDLVAQLVAFAEEAWARMNAIKPIPESGQVINFDVAFIDGKPGMIESHTVERLGLYSMNIQNFIAQLLRRCLSQAV